MGCRRWAAFLGLFSIRSRRLPHSPDSGGASIFLRLRILKSLQNNDSIIAKQYNGNIILQESYKTERTMLLEFSIENYKSFADKATFSMEAAPKQKGLDYSLHAIKVGRKTYKGLSSAVVYGPNAAGKTAIIGAMDTLKHIVMRGNVRDAETMTSLDRAAFDLSFIPNSGLAVPKPVSFGIRFFEGGDLFEYNLKIDLGGFMDPSYGRAIVRETLLVNERMVFDREPEAVELGDLDPAMFSGQVSDVFRENRAAAVKFLSVLDGEELFLTNGFKQIVSPKLSARVTGWFDRGLTVVYRADSLTTVQGAGLPDKAVYINKTIDTAAKEFGVSSNALGFVVPEGEGVPRLSSIFADEEGNLLRAVPAEDYESYGTVRFVNLFPLVAQAIATGGTLVVDEFDASIHPMALMSIVSVLHNDEVNRRGAQLIFNTHNPVFLNGNVFRRDEIKFVERDRETGGSTCYALSDFGTSGPSGVRKGDDYMKSYFVSRYGAIEDIDFTPVFEELMGDDGDGE